MIDFATMIVDKATSKVKSETVTNKICPVRKLKFDRTYRWLDNHSKTLTYQVSIVL